MFSKLMSQTVEFVRCIAYIKKSSIYFDHIWVQFMQFTVFGVATLCL